MWRLRISNKTISSIVKISVPILKILINCYYIADTDSDIEAEDLNCFAEAEFAEAFPDSHLEKCGCFSIQ